MEKKNVLIIADKEDVKFLNTSARSDYLNLFWKVIDYNQLYRKIEEIRKLIVENDIDFILYSQNDQVANKISIGPIHKKLKLGYSSFSGIDDKFRVEQMVTCFNDFLKTGVNLNFDLPKQKTIRNYNIRKSEGTFSLIFDTEQLGGVRFGLPRILELLNKYGIKATFFITNLMKKIYPNILDEISCRGHEIGIHGKYHEYLLGKNKEDQSKAIIDMVKGFYPVVISGANFIGRMDDETISALIANKLNYFVYPFIHNYVLFNFLKLPTTPCRFCRNEKKIWMIPISVETYGCPWIIIKPMLDSAICETSKTEFKHITILLHPFRDGNLKHIKTTQRLLDYLIKKRRLSPVTLCATINNITRKKHKPLPTYYFKEQIGMAILKRAKRYALIPKNSQDIRYAPIAFAIKIISRLKHNRTVF